MKAKPKAPRSSRPLTPARSESSPATKPAGRSFLASIADIEVEPIPVSEAERARLRKVRSDWLARWLAEDPQLIEQAGRTFETVGSAIRSAAQQIPGKPGRTDRLTHALEAQVIASYGVLKNANPDGKLTWCYTMISDVLNIPSKTVGNIIRAAKKAGSAP